VKVGDFIVEQHRTGWDASAQFGVVTAIHEDETVSVRFPHGTFYTFARYCQPYKEWLNENGF